jgi:hypothetical protein
MNYKKALHNDQDIVKHKETRIFGISLMVWILSGLALIAIAASLSVSIGY